MLRYATGEVVNQMMTILMALFGVLLPLVASATLPELGPDDFVRNPIPLLTAADLPPGSRGVDNGAPAIDEHREGNKLIVVGSFTAVAPDQPEAGECLHGIHGVYVATFTSHPKLGLQKQAVSTFVPDPIRDAGTPYACGIRRPTAIIGTAENLLTVEILAEMEQPRYVCDDLDTDPQWGCSVYSGIGHMSATLLGNGRVKDWNLPVNIDPALQFHSAHGYPSMVVKDGRYQLLNMWLGREVYASSADNLDGPWSTPVLVIGREDVISDINVDEVKPPAMVCGGGDDTIDAVINVTDYLNAPAPRWNEYSTLSLTTTNDVSDWGDFIDATDPVMEFDDMWNPYTTSALRFGNDEDPLNDELVLFVSEFNYKQYPLRELVVYETSVGILNNLRRESPYTRYCDE